MKKNLTIWLLIIFQALTQFKIEWTTVNKYIVIMLILLAVSCKKDDLAINKRPDLKGTWIYDAEAIYIVIRDNGEGSYRECPNVRSPEDRCKEGSRGTVRIEGDHLQFGRFGKKIKIDDDPPCIDNDGNLIMLFDEKVFVGCRAPGITYIGSITSNSVNIAMGWDVRLTDGSFIAYFKPAYSNNWDSLLNQKGSFHLPGLLDSTDYEIKVKCICSFNRESEFSKVETFKTK